ncbi:MAG: hypothetical protein LBP43_05740 [Treponema sp.]|jgi:hypothetical protein|nr:hypothetical protein [Treponema sp.]
MECNILKLDLRAPLFYVRDRSLNPFDALPLTGEFLFCFEVNTEQGFRIDPQGETYLGSLIDRGRQAPEKPAWDLELPRGKYLFAQMRELLSREASVDMAMEIQKEGLWERQQLGARLYLRYLFEDQNPVTQIFRPLI